MGVRLDEGILNRLVRLGGIAHVVKRDSRCASLVPAHQFGISLARFGVPPFGLQGLDCRRGATVRFTAAEACYLSSCHEIRLEPGVVYLRGEDTGESVIDSKPIIVERNRHR